MGDELIKRSVRLPVQVDEEIIAWARLHQEFFPDNGTLNYSDVVRVGMSWFLSKISPETPIPGIDTSG